MRSLAKAGACLLTVSVLLVGSVPHAMAGGTPAASAGPAAAAPATTVPDASAWQDVVSGQIEAFRKGDGAAALKLAGQAFRKSFSDPDVFLVSIVASGYGPIFTSVSHSFGSFSQPDDDTVMQIVHLVGPNQESYEAVYALGKEADGWRVQGVTLTKDEGVNV